MVYGGRGQGVRMAGRRRGAQLTPGLLLRPWWGKGGWLVLCLSHRHAAIPWRPEAWRGANSALASLLPRLADPSPRSLCRRPECSGHAGLAANSGSPALAGEELDCEAGRRVVTHRLVE